MKHLRTPLALLAVSAALALSTPACTKSDRERCATCGMYTDLDPAFTARRGEKTYDTPKCLWGDLLATQGDPAEASVTEYYAQQPVPAGRAVYVVGSDIQGPMGPDLIPLKDRSDAERFAREHGGRVIPAPQVDRALLDSL